MCLINFQFQEHPNYKLIIAANRDEFYKRPTAPVHFWEDEPTILAGRDLLQMGTWLGITKQGRFGALTNYRDPAHMTNDKTSRGEIISNYLIGDISAEDYLTSLNMKKEDYNGFNLIIGSPDQMFYYNNIEGQIIKISTGTHGLSNHFLNTPWPKVTSGKKMLHDYLVKQELIQPNELFDILSDAKIAEDLHLPKTGIDIKLERQLSPIFIKTAEYGTRCSTVLLVDKENNVTFIERTYQNGLFKNEIQFIFHIE